MENKRYRFIFVDSLQKIFPDEEPAPIKRKEISGLYGDTLSFQLAYTMIGEGCQVEDPDVELELVSDLEESIHIRRVELVPATLAAQLGQTDENYLFDTPRLCPDILTERTSNRLWICPEQWRSLWFDVELRPGSKAGVHTVTLRIKRQQELIWEDEIRIRVITARLPKQKLIYTQWLHCDCLADYYRTEVFSEKFWNIVENFIRTAANSGINMILTPLFTPPLDTDIGAERRTVQLVKIRKEKQEYFFDFTQLSRWFEMCQSCGIKYYEMPHLFTQWGAKHAPKVIVTENGQEKKLFGWHTDAADGEYTEFLRQLLTQLKEVLRNRGILENTYFHISDEPHEADKESYQKARNTVWPFLSDCHVIDALSDISFYEEGIVAHPIPASDRIEPFIEAKVPHLWTYYCCTQGKQVSNRFMAMPSARNRIIGVQMYLYGIEGFLQWGYNFYSSHKSRESINPYLITDAGGVFPSGDPFSVYPSEKQTALESIRLAVFAEALRDLRALQLLEELKGKEFVKKMIYENLDYEITFKKYPAEADYILALREKVNSAIEKEIL